MTQHVIERPAERAEQHDFAGVARRGLRHGKLGVGLVLAHGMLDDFDAGRAGLCYGGGVERVEIADQQGGPAAVAAQKGVAAVGGHDRLRRVDRAQVVGLVFVLAVQQDDAGHARGAAAAGGAGLVVGDDAETDSRTTVKTASGTRYSRL